MLKCLINDSCVVHNGHPTHKGMLADIIIKKSYKLVCIPRAEFLSRLAVGLVSLILCTLYNHPMVLICIIISENFTIVNFFIRSGI